MFFECYFIRFVPLGMRSDSHLAGLFCVDQEGQLPPRRLDIGKILKLGAVQNTI